MNRLTQYYEAPDPADSRYLASEELKEESKNQCSGLGNRVGNSIEKVFNKLGMLEDIEEELGCPLDVLFKALRDGIYTSIVHSFDMPCTHFFVTADDEVLHTILSMNECWWYIRDYKKTWWLKEDKSE